MLQMLFSSRVRAKLLTAFFLFPGTDRNAWELAHSLNESYGAVWKELNRLEAIGVLQSETKGNARAYQINPGCPIVPELRSIILKTEGVGGVIRKNLNVLGNIHEAFIYGSFASGEADERSDIDLMLIGEVDLEELSPVISALEKELNRPVNYGIFSKEEWDERLARQEPFAMNVAQSAKVTLVGG